MKLTLFASFLLCSTTLFFSCAGGNETGNAAEGNSNSEGSPSTSIDTMALLEGNWKIDSISSDRYELYDCEKSMNFNFTSDAGESSNGIETKVLKVTQGEDNPCDFAGPNDNYETVYTLYMGMLYVKNFKMDKKQLSGTLKISNLSNNTITLTSMRHSIHLSKKN